MKVTKSDIRRALPIIRWHKQYLANQEDRRDNGEGRDAAYAAEDQAYELLNRMDKALSLRRKPSAGGRP